MVIQIYDEVPTLLPSILYRRTMFTRPMQIYMRRGDSLLHFK